MTDANPNTQTTSQPTVTEHRTDAAVPAPSTQTPSPGGPTPEHSGRSVPTPSNGAGTGGIAPERAKELRRRWSELKGEFVDNPRDAASKARDVASEVLDELEQALRKQHGTLGGTLGADPKTEDLRVTINRYQEFSERLLSF